MLEIELQNLERDETVEQLTLVLGRPPGSALADRIHSRSRGQPLFTEHLAAHAGGDETLPRFLADLLDQRFTGVRDATWQVARVLGVAARPLTTTQLITATGLDRDELTAELRDLTRRRLVMSTPDGSVQLQHPLLAEAARRRLVAGEAADVHRSLARALGGDPDASPAEVAAHWQGTDDPAQEIDWRIRAARDSASRYDAAGEAEQWLRALAIWPTAAATAGEPPLLRATAYLSAMDALYFSLQWDRAAAMYDDVDAHFGDLDDATRAELLLRGAEYRGEREGFAVGLTLIDEALAIHDRLPPGAGRLEALNKKRLYLMHLGRFTEAQEVARAAAAAASGLGDRHWQRHHLMSVAWFEGVDGDLTAAFGSLAAAAALLPAGSDPLGDITRATLSTDLLLVCGGNLDRVESAARPGLLVAEHWGIDNETVMLLRYNLAQARIRAGYIARAADLVDTEPDQAVDTERWPQEQVRAHIDALSGRLDAATERIDYLWREVGPDDDVDLETLALMATIHVWHGTPTMVLERLLHDLSTVVDEMPVRIVCPALVAAAWAAAEAASARGVDRSEHLDVLRELGARFDLTSSQHVDDHNLRAHALTWTGHLARLSRSETVDHWVTAAAAWDTLVRPHDAAYCRWRAAEAALRGGQGTIAAHLLKRAAIDAREHVPLSRAIRETAGGGTRPAAPLHIPHGREESGGWAPGGRP